MKKTLLITFILALVLSTSALGASVTRTFEPTRVAPGEDVKVTFAVSGATVGEVFTIEDRVPSGWNLAAWDVQGVEGGRNAVNYRLADTNRHGFSFTTSSANPTVSITLRIPASADLSSHAFDAVYFDSSGQSRSQGSLTVRQITCGDNVCEGTETTDSCAADCKAAVVPPVQPPTPPQPAPESKGSSALLIAVILAIAIIGAGVAVYFVKKPKKAVKKAGKK